MAITASGALTVATITTTGGADAGDTQGRNAGTVVLNSTAGVLTTAVITATGSAPTTASNAAGAGGLVTLTGNTRIDWGGDIDTSGGAADTVGAGGTVTFNSPVVLLANRAVTT